jgi:hypothetical protein
VIDDQCERAMYIRTPVNIVLVTISLCELALPRRRPNSVTFQKSLQNLAVSHRHSSNKFTLIPSCMGDLFHVVGATLTLGFRVYRFADVRSLC